MSLEEYGVNTITLPAGGGGQWYYEQEWDGEKIRMTEQSPERLLASIRNFRINQHLPMGEPERDLANYILERCPANRLFGRAAAPDQPRVRQIKPMAERLREWLSSDRTRPKRLVGQDEALKRAQICAECTQNQLRWESSCVQCNDQVESEGRLMRQKVQAPMDDELGGCRIYGMYLPAATFLDRDELPDRNEKSPSKCWVKRDT